MDATVTAVFRFALDLAFKATLIFSTTGLALVTLSRRPAAERHLVGTLAFSAALLFPFLAPLLPQLEVPLFPAPVPRRAAVAAERAAAPLPDRVPETARAVGRVPRAAVEIFAAASTPEPDEPPALRAVSSPPSPPPAARFELPLPAMAAALLLWIAVAAALLARLAVGAARARRLRRRAVPVRDPEWSELASALSESFPTRRPVALFFSDGIPVAVTSGLRRPSLLLPESAQGWDLPRRRVVLLHELAHVERRDWPALLLAEVAVAVYWFHPLSWTLARRLRRDAERAADDRVLAAGTKASVYAGHLLGIFRSLKDGAGRPLPVMGMARPSHFEERLRSILDPAVARERVTGREARVAAALFLAGAASLAILQPWSARCAEAALPEGMPEAGSSAPAVLASASRPRSPKRTAEKSHEKKACSGEKEPAPKVSHEKAGLAATAWTPAPAAVPGFADVGEAVPPALEALPPLAPVDETPPAPAGFLKAGNPSSRDGKDAFRRASKLHDEERWAEASREFQRAYAAGYRTETSAYNAACGLAREGDTEQAMRWLERAAAEGFDVLSYLSEDEDLESLRSDPRLPEWTVALRREQAAAHRDEAARLEDRFRRLSEEFPRGARDLYGLGKELLDAGSYEVAAQAFRLSAKAGLQTGASFYNAACAYALAGDRGRALDLLRQSLEAGFDDPSLLRKDEDLAAIRKEPGYRELVALSDALELKSTEDSDSGDREREIWAKAAREYEKVAAAHPGLGRAWFNLGFASLASGDAARSVQAFEKALALDYRPATTMYNLACANARLGRKDEAFGYLFEALHRGFANRGMLKEDEDLDALRSDARFREALKLARTEKSEEF